ncbi:hypothetical protein FA15DRAFT_408594 [Coprinopsis marcescibilis]|uniref:Uncharacterized protein n=1 Tax=Coprinopsis marcescibilis TaxID=230819 RepID=A0A5C3KWR1_COPMA|nr:hypothetical protein FA15DRAFT_408594 [Coprinopsis marcescibilis]
MISVLEYNKGSNGLTILTRLLPFRRRQARSQPPTLAEQRFWLEISCRNDAHDQALWDSLGCTDDRCPCRAPRCDDGPCLDDLDFGYCHVHHLLVVVGPYHGFCPCRVLSNAHPASLFHQLITTALVIIHASSLFHLRCFLLPKVVSETKG